MQYRQAMETSWIPWINIHKRNFSLYSMKSLKIPKYRQLVCNMILSTSSFPNNSMKSIQKTLSEIFNYCFVCTSQYNSTQQRLNPNNSGSTTWILIVNIMRHTNLKIMLVILLQKYNNPKLPNYNKTYPP